MRIVNETGAGNTTRVFDDNGQDITAALAIVGISLSILPGQPVTATMTCIVDQFDIEIEDGEVIAKILDRITEN